MEPDALDTPVARHVWETRYRAGEAEPSIEATWRRVALALAAVEPVERANWQRRFFDIMQGLQFLPGGRIQAGAGTGRDVTLLNCFVMGPIEDSIPGIFHALEEGAVTMQHGGGVGYDFSTLRPAGAQARTTGMMASGPVSFMDVWDAMCATIQSSGARRGAMMATLRCDHPDISAFAESKRETGRLRRFNLSVQVTDDFMAAVDRDETWSLVFPASRFDRSGETVLRAWPGDASPVPCCVVTRTPARALWETLLRASYDSGEPGALFIDRINQLNNLSYCERITATNPCGEVPLPSYGACDLGSINLARLIQDPFTPQARLNTSRLVEITATAVRLLDNVIDVSRFPLPSQRETARRTRRIGLGVTGLADALTMLGLRYGSDASLAFAGETMRAICHAAYRQSVGIAEEKGCFPVFDSDQYLAARFIRALPDDIRDGIARHGIRNSHLLAIAPTGTISLLAGNVSTGIEPAFAADCQRTVLDRNGAQTVFAVTDYAVRLWRQQTGQSDGVPDAFVTAGELPIEAHLTMQAALQSVVDNSISKTINVPERIAFADFAPVYQRAYDLGLKGCTVFRTVAARASVFSARQQQDAGLTTACDCE